MSMRFKPAAKQRCKHFYKRPAMDVAADWDLQSQSAIFDDHVAQEMLPLYPDKLQIR